MAYLGSPPTTSSQSLVKQDFSVSATQNYTLSQSVSSANDIALYINNVRQEPTYAYSASGTALTLTAATAGTDDMYCVYLGRAVGTINPASGSVGTNQLVNTAVTGAKINTDAISAQTELATEPADTDEFLVSDGGVLKRIDYSHIKGGAHTLLNSTTLSSSSDVQIQGLMTGYSMYLVLYKIQRSTNLIPRLYFMSGSTILSANYHTQGVYGSGSGNAQTYPDDGQGYMNLTSTWSGNQSATETPVVGHLYIIDPNDSNDYTYAYGQNCFWSSSSTLVTNINSMSSSTAQAQDGIRFYPSTGNFANGFIKLYGITG